MTDLTEDQKKRVFQHLRQAVNELFQATEAPIFVEAVIKESLPLECLNIKDANVLLDLGIQLINELRSFLANGKRQYATGLTKLILDECPEVVPGNCVVTEEEKQAIFDACQKNLGEPTTPGPPDARPVMLDSDIYHNSPPAARTSRTPNAADDEGGCTDKPESPAAQPRESTMEQDIRDVQKFGP